MRETVSWRVRKHHKHLRTHITVKYAEKYVRISGLIIEYFFRNDLRENAIGYYTVIEFQLSTAQSISEMLMQCYYFIINIL